MGSLFYSSFSSIFDDITITWKEIDTKILVQRVFLSNQKQKSEVKMLELFPTAKKASSSLIDTLGDKIQRFLKGEDISFDLTFLDFSRCYPIQKKVLLAEYAIPRGWISTYKRIAEQIGIKNGARVVGHSLAKNPFPIFIPCHRAIRTDGKLGGYQGGLEMKKKLLEMEGVKIIGKTVFSKKIYY
jgi:methylated-DNA-[protein]-cysteine S-methyltransferase